MKIFFSWSGLVSKRMLFLLSVFAFVMTLSGLAHADYNFTTFDVPGARTSVIGIDGNNIVGQYYGSNMWHGFLYDGKTYTTLTVQGSNYNSARSIDGNNIVGAYRDSISNNMHTYLYNITTKTYTSITVPGSFRTDGLGIDGNNIVGAYDNGRMHGFLYDGTIYTTLDVPDADNGTTANGIDGNYVVGMYFDKNHSNGLGYLYNIDSETYTTLSVPDSTYTAPFGIDGNYIVGECQIGSVGYGFLYDMTTNIYTTITFPGSYGTAVQDIDGSTIVGNYYDGISYHGFVATSSATVPEPATMILSVWV